MDRAQTSESVGTTFREVQIKGQRKTRSPCWSEAEAKTVVDQWKASGLNISEFSRQQGFHKDRLRHWVERFQSKQNTAVQEHEKVLQASDGNCFVHLQFEQGTQLQVQLPEGALLRLVTLLSAVG
jgi:transposase-like protein